MGGLKADAFWDQIHVKDWFCFTFSLIILALFLYNLYKYSKSKSSKKILIQLKLVSFIFMLSYLVQNIIYIYQSLTKSTSFAGTNIAKIVLVTTFNLFLIFRLYYSFKETVYALNSSTFIILIILSMVDTFMYSCLQHCVGNTVFFDWDYCTFYLWAHIVLDTIIGIMVIYLFINKLLRLLLLQSTYEATTESINSNGDTNADEKPSTGVAVVYMDRSELDLNKQQQNLLIVITKHTLLQCLAVLSNNIYFIVWSAYLYGMNLSDNKIEIIYEVVLVLWWIGSITLWIKLICVYLGFPFASTCYFRLCMKCNNGVNKYCLSFARRKMVKEMEKVNETEL